MSGGDGVARIVVCFCNRVCTVAFSLQCFCDHYSQRSLILCALLTLLTLCFFPQPPNCLQVPCQPACWLAYAVPWRGTKRDPGVPRWCDFDACVRGNALCSEQPIVIDYSCGEAPCREGQSHGTSRLYHLRVSARCQPRLSATCFRVCSSYPFTTHPSRPELAFFTAHVAFTAMLLRNVFGRRAMVRTECGCR